MPSRFALREPKTHHTTLTAMWCVFAVKARLDGTLQDRDANHVHVRGCWVVDHILGKE